MNENIGQRNHEAFSTRAGQILDMLGARRVEADWSTVLDEARERYVEVEQNESLRLLGEVLLRARQMAQVQRRLDDDREALHHGHLDHEEHVSVGHHYEMLRREACEYNHLLRGMIETDGRDISRHELIGWLAEASLGRADWAKAEVTGAVSEIALHAALQGMPELLGLRYGTLEEDLSGYDFGAKWQGALVTFDAKTGHYEPLSEQKHGHRHLEISVPHQAVRDLRVTREGINSLRRDVRWALNGQLEAKNYTAPNNFRPFRQQTA